MILADNELKERLNEIIIENKLTDQVQPCSIDLHLANDLKTIRGEPISGGNVFKLAPQEFILGSTYEKIHIPHDLVGIVNGKSTLGRLGLMVHVTAGFVDAGFTGNITLELFNVSDEPVTLYAGMSICQLVLEQLTSTVSNPYGSKGVGSHYQNSVGTVVSVRNMPQ